MDKKNRSIIRESTAREIDNDFEEKEINDQNLIEASLFVAGRFLTIEEIVMLTDLSPLIIKNSLNKLEKKYSNTPLRFIQKNNSWKMDVAEEYHYLINKLATGSPEFTKAEQETLAIIAYKQPVKQSVVIKIRGNKSYDHIKKFQDLGLVIAKPKGHTLELYLSEEFYEYFNVHNKVDGKQ
jgi:segregation and condensation protein B